MKLVRTGIINGCSSMAHPRTHLTPGMPKEKGRKKRKKKASGKARRAWRLTIARELGSPVAFAACDEDGRKKEEKNQLRCDNLTSDRTVN